MLNDFRITTSPLPPVQRDAIDLLVKHLSPCPTQTPYRICSEGTALDYEIPEPEMRAALGVFINRWRIPTRYGRTTTDIGCYAAGDVVRLWADLGYALGPKGFRDALAYIWEVGFDGPRQIPRNLPDNPYEALAVVKHEITEWYAEDDAEDDAEVRDFLNLGPAVIAAIYVWAQRRAILRMEDEMDEFMARRAKTDRVFDEVDREVEGLIPLVCESVAQRKMAA
jgi:hypothetical protein